MSFTTSMLPFLTWLQKKKEAYTSDKDNKKRYINQVRYEMLSVPPYAVEKSTIYTTQCEGETAENDL
jgi:hypothetical protein